MVGAGGLTKSREGGSKVSGRIVDERERQQYTMLNENGIEEGVYFRKEIVFWSK